MPVNLRNRSFLKELDFTPAELRFLLKLSADLKTAKYAGTEVQRLAGKNIGLIFEKTSTRTRCAFEVASHDQGAHVTYLDPSGSQMGHKESVDDTARVLGRFYDAIEYRGKAQADVEELAEYSGVPVWNGLTDDWHPTQMLADFLTMGEHSGKDYGDLSYAFMGDLRFNMGRSHLVTAALLGSDIRMVGPEGAGATGRTCSKAAQDIAATTGATHHRQRRPSRASRASTSSTPTCGSPWASPRMSGTSGSRCSSPTRSTPTSWLQTGNADVKFMHCLPAFHDSNTEVGAEMMEATGMPNGLEVTDEVFESPASIVFDQAENRLHTIKAVMVATLGS